MAFPTEVRRGGAVSSSTNATTWSPTVSFAITNGLDTAVSAGEKVLWTLHVAADGIPTLTETGGQSWAKVGQISEAGSQVTGAVFTLETTGAFAAGVHPAITITSSVAEQFSCLLYADKAGAGMNLAILSASTQGTGTNANPAAITNNSGAAQDVNVRCSRLGDGSTTIPTAAPTNYGTLVTQVGSGTTGANCGGAFRAINIANSGTEDPGTFTSPNEQWASWTVGVYESSSGGTKALIFDRMAHLRPLLAR